MTREDFQRYWHTTHGPLVVERADVLGIRRYRQIHTTREGRADAPPGFDGVAELWFDQRPDSPELRQAARDLLDDEARFIDLARSPLFLADEVVMYDGKVEGECMIAALRRLPGTTRADFQRHWREVHGPLALTFPELGFRDYVQLHTVADAESYPPALRRGAPAPFDGVTEVYRDEWTGSPDSLRAARAVILEDEDRFMDHASSPTWWGRVEVLLDQG